MIVAGAQHQMGRKKLKLQPIERKIFGQLEVADQFNFSFVEISEE